MILLAAMVPAPGEPPGAWWENTAWPAAHRAEVERLGGDDSPGAMFMHDVAPALASEANARNRDQSGTPFEAPWPLERWPDVPTRFILCREDHFFPAAFLRRVVRERLGFSPDDMDSGHLPMLSRPAELVDRLQALALG